MQKRSKKTEDVGKNGRQGLKKKQLEKIEFAEWCMQQCRPGFEGCKYRGDGIDWLKLREKCKKRSGKHAKSI